MVTKKNIIKGIKEDPNNDEYARINFYLTKKEDKIKWNFIKENIKGDSQILNELNIDKNKSLSKSQICRIAFHIVSKYYKIKQMESFRKLHNVQKTIIENKIKMRQLING